MSMQRDLSKRELSLVAVAIAVILTVLGGGFFMKQKVDADNEVALMRIQMRAELGQKPISDNQGIVEVEEQQADPHFMP